MKSLTPEKPIFFLKPDTAILRRNRPFYIPDFSSEIHYEVEIVLKLSRVGKNISPRFAHRYFNEIGIGIDFTARDLQQYAKQNGLPWEPSKAFDNAAAISEFVDKNEFPAIHNLNFSLLINNKTVQQGNTQNMIFPIEEQIAYVSKFMTIRMGDLLFTGTPAGVGAVKPGDRLQAFIEDRLMIDFLIK